MQRSRFVRSSATAAAVLAAALLAGCGSHDSTPPAGPADKRTVVVFAAASLGPAFTELGKIFEQRNPGTEVRLDYGGSFNLAQQILERAPADVFAAANPLAMDTVAHAGLVNGRPRVFGTDTLQIAVPTGAEKGVRSFADLARPDLRVVVCAQPAPCGTATERVERLSGVALEPVSREFDAPAALAQVISGDADAAVVYASDVRSAPGKVQGVDFPEATKAVDVYPIAALKNAPAPDLAARWVALVDGPDGRKALNAAGFATPGRQ